MSGGDGLAMRKDLARYAEIVRRLEEIDKHAQRHWQKLKRQINQEKVVSLKRFVEGKENIAQ